MKILIFSNTSWNIYNYRINLIEALQSMGHEVLLLAPMDSYTKSLQEAGYNWIDFPISRKGMNLLKEVLVLFRLKNTYAELQPDVVFQYTPKCVLYGSFVAKVCGIPKIVNTITGLGYLFSGPRSRHPLVRQIIRGFYFLALKNTTVIFQNEENRILFIRQKIVDEAQSVLIAGSGVDMHVFQYYEEKPGTPKVLFPARLIKEKGIFEFVEAARMLRQQNIDCEFIVVGRIDEGNPSAISKEQMQSWIEEGVVTWLGWRSDMQDVFREVHIICLPTYYHEGTPKTLIEAASCGRPIIASDAPGCREIVHHEENGLLIQPKDAEILANSIKQIVNDPSLRKQMGIAGHQLVEEYFHDEVIVEQILQVAEIDKNSN